MRALYELTVELVLLTQLESEGLVSIDPIPDSEDDHSEEDRFTFQRLSDHFISTRLLEPCTIELILRQELGEGSTLQRWFLTPHWPQYAGVVEALAFLIVEKYQLEIPDLLGIRHRWGTEEAFKSSLLSRPQGVFFERTLSLLGDLFGEEEAFVTRLAIALIGGLPSGQGDNALRSKDVAPGKAGHVCGPSMISCGVSRQASNCRFKISRSIP